MQSVNNPLGEAMLARLRHTLHWRCPLRAGSKSRAAQRTQPACNPSTFVLRQWARNHCDHSPTLRYQPAVNPFNHHLFLSTAVRPIALAFLDQKGKIQRLEVRDPALSNL